jgi:hypothetical protein
MTPPDDTVPISALFFDDAGPHVVRAGFPSKGRESKLTPAKGQELRALLNTSIAQLGAVSGETRRKTPVPPAAPVPIDTLVYHGRAALDRAVELRNEIVEAKRPPTREKIEELLDLVVLASTE